MWRQRTPSPTGTLPFLLLAWGLALAAPDAVDIGSRRELFLDGFLIGRLSGVELRLAQPVDAGPVLPLDRPEEGPFCNYATVVHDGAIYRLYYRGLPVVAHSTSVEVTCYAESHDGIHWVKPDLGLYEMQGTRRNNVILANRHLSRRV